MAELRQRVLEAIDANWEREVEFLRGLVARPSTLGDEAPRPAPSSPPSSAAWASTLDVWEIDHAAIARLPGYGPVEWSYAGPPERRRALAGRRRGRALARASSGHVDVVPATPEDHWTHAPWAARSPTAACGGAAPRT